MERLQRAKGSRKAYRSHLTRIYRKIEDIFEAEAPMTDSQISTLTSALEQLNVKKTQISQLDAEILQVEEVQGELLDKITRLRQFFEQRSRVTVPTRELDAHAAEFTPTHPVTEAPHSSTVTISTSTSPTTTTLSSAARREPVSRLPKLSLPTFSGNPLMWQGFRDSFDAAVHNNPSLDGIQKFNYLRAQLEGDAARVIAGLPLTSANYNNAVSLLTERFGQPHKIINAHMQALLDVANPVNSLPSLQLFYDTIEGHIRGLAALGKSEDSYGALLIPIILGKLPTDIQRNLARDHGSLEWTLQDLKQGVLREIRVLESSLSINPTTRLSFDQHPMMTTTSLHTGASNNITPRVQNSSSKRLCVFCKSPNHPPTKCDTIVERQKRIDFIKKENLCFNCFGHHKASHCNSKYRCKNCKRKHHTSLCDTATATKTNTDQTKNSTTPPTADSTTALVVPVSSQPKSTSTSHSLVSSTSTGCLLKTAVAEVRAGTHHCKANILFDEGAQKSFISQKLADSLHAQSSEHQNICLSSFGGMATPTKLQATQVYLQTKTEEVPISVLIVPKIATPLKNLVSTPIEHFPHLQGLTLAHPTIHTSDFEISLLIGADFYWTIVQDRIIRGNGPTAMESKLGYLLSGPIPSQMADNTFQMFHTIVQPLEEYDITKFWDVESTGTLSTTESSCDNQFLASYLKSSVVCQPDGSYVVKFPWKDKHPPLPSNRHICEKRARSLAIKLSHTPNLLQLYGEIISDQLKRGFIEEVAETKIPSQCHFIPHHPVQKDSTTTPIRIVYDCSCRQSTNHPSLNDCLQVGPPLINDLCTLLLRFRTHKIGIVTDIEKAFLHVQLAEEDRNYTHFLWLSKPSDPTSKFTIYRFKVVLFGSVSSPFMLNATLQHLLNTDGSPVAMDIQQNLYVDNVISGFSNEEKAVQYYNKARQIMSNANFNLRSWASNSTKLMKVAQEDNVADSRTIVNVLGLLWDTSADTLTLNPKDLTSTQHSPVTKRTVLKDISKIFDPLGMVAPVTITSKLFMQELWQRQLDWDEPLPDDMKTRWHSLGNDLQLTFSYQISRFYHNPETLPMEMHVFVDASKKAYGAVAYICQGGQPSLIMSKTRVAPIKELTLPKLELMAAVIGTRLYKFIIASLPQQCTDIPIFLWSDSQIVLYWILNQRKLKSFVASRIQEINNSVPTNSWRYCPTQDNPADLVTRGIPYQAFTQCKLWEYGPSWISNKKHWPEWNSAVTLNLQVDTDESVEVTVPPKKPSLETLGLHQIMNISDYSSLTKLLHVSAYILRFVMNAKQTDISQRRLSTLLPEEVTKASQAWIRTCQQTTFTDEFINLQSQNVKTKRLPLVRQLRLFLDNKGIIRCGGRIHNAPLDDNTKFPALLPKEHPLTKLIVYAVHKQQLHTGVNSTVAALRQEYWIPSARQLVRRLLRQCVSCRKVMGKAYSIPDPSPLPRARIKEGKPFEVTGVDFTGALYVKNPGGESKVYICLFTCGLTRAIHLEVVSDLNLETFLQAFRRFVARRSLPRLMLSDNASTYTAAARELEQLFSSPELEGALSLRGIKWQFIPKRAPWYGGFWERMIGLTKTTIRKVLGRSFITLEALQTLVVEIEAVLNDRPLTYLSADVDDPEPLTPSHLLYGRRITTLPHLEFQDDELTDPTYCAGSTLREKSKRQTQLLQHFQSRWKKEYITSLREAHRMTGTNTQTVKVGDIVLIHDDTPRMQWRLAVIEELIEGLDGFVRAAKIRTSSGKTNRPIAKLFPLEVNVSEEQGASDHIGIDSNPGDRLTDDDTPPVHGRAKRDAAVRARNRVKYWTNALSVGPEDVDD